MVTIPQLIIIRAAKDFGITVNSHIKGRKEVHLNILRDFALSTFKDREKAQWFIRYVKKLSQGSKKWH